MIALGGNALLPAHGSGTIDEQIAITRRTMRVVARLALPGVRLVVTHGNGPVVGNILVRNLAAADRIAPMPLDVCGADSQGGLGYMIQQTLENELFLLGRHRPVVTLVSQVRVDGRDPAFEHADKPIGPFVTAGEAERLRAEHGWEMVQDAGRGWRRVVPSPIPVEIVEEQAIRTLRDSGFIVIALGGGGVPVIRRDDGTLEGVEAVIDKDRASAVLARDLRIPSLVIVTAVDRVRLGFGTPDEQPLSAMTLAEARLYLAEGQFGAGSMGPKIEAVCDFLDAGGREAILCAPDQLAEALGGEAGTRVTR
ncbi:MAG TPA: carbamate kinase [Candidatus Eisenbacteria bacterium]